MRGNISLPIVLSTLLLIVAPACSEDLTGSAYFEIEEGENLPCIGVKRFRVVATDGKSEKVFDNYGEYYDQEGRCKQPVYAIAVFDGLNTSTMMVRAEGFDSSEKRRISVGSLGPISKADADRGYIGTMVIDREPASEGGMVKYPISYPKGTVVVAPLERLDEIVEIDSLAFILNSGTADSINGRFLTNPEVPLKDTEFAISSVSPFDHPGSLVIVARYKNVSVGQWKNSNDIRVEAGDLFVETTMVKEQ